MNNLTHEKYIEVQKRKILSIAEKMLKTNFDLIEGCREIWGLWWEAELPEDDNYRFFSLINSDTDTFPKGSLREMCSEDYLRAQDQREKEYLKTFEKQIMEECHKLIEKYGPEKETPSSSA